MFCSRDRNSLALKREVLRVDNYGFIASFTNSSQRFNTTVDYNMDGERHYVVVSWNRTFHRLSIVVDTIRDPFYNYDVGLFGNMR